MAKRGEKTRAGNRWTEARFKSFIKSLLRAGTMRWAPKYDAIRAAFVKRGLNSTTGRMAKLHKCNICSRLFPQSLVKVDHINPVIDPHIGFVSWDIYIQRMFCEVENFQVLCQKCHDFKTRKDSLKGRQEIAFKAVRSRSRKVFEHRSKLKNLVANAADAASVRTPHPNPSPRNRIKAN